MNSADAAPVSFILATAGHVDHGKSSLVRALTGTDPDRLPEEKARGITIDLGFAHLELESAYDPQQPESPPRRFSCGWIDVPGHEDFVGNMVSGVGAIDLALLTVAGDDGWMPQTEEHLQILIHLGVRHAVVALTKADLCADLAAASTEIRAQLVDTPFAKAPILPTSIHTGAGLLELRTALARILTSLSPAPDIGKPRLWIDRAFSLPGAGTIVTGTLTGGCLKPGDGVLLQPAGAAAQIRACHSHGRPVPVAHPGTRIALNLPALGSDANGPAHLNAHRGDVVALPDFGMPSRTLDVRVERLARDPVAGAENSWMVESGATVLLQLGSARIAARLLLLDRARLAPGETAIAQLRLTTPILAFAGDRFVLRDESRRWTLAGGVVLDPDAPRARARNPDRLHRLQQGTDLLALLRLHAARHGLLPANQILRPSRWSSTAIAGALATGLVEQWLALVGPWVIHADLLATWNQRAQQLVHDHHAAHPEQPGIPLQELRSRLRQHLPLCDPAFAELCSLLRNLGLHTNGTIVHEALHPATTDPSLAARQRRLIDRLQQSGVDAPSVATLAPDAPSKTALRELIRQGQVVELGADAVLTREAFELARRRILDHLTRAGSATASELRQLLGTSRRVLIPLLERFDREGFTRRDGNLRRRGPRETEARPRSHP